MITDKVTADVPHKTSDAPRGSTAAPGKPARAATPGLDLFTFVQKLAADLGGDLELPGFPDIVIRLHRVLGDAKSSARDIVRLISSEPALGARLVHLANSAAFNNGEHSISDLRSAITVLGFDLVRSTATSFAVRQLEQQEWLKPLRPHLARVWKDSVAVAAICFTAARRIEGMKPDEALAAGLFHHLGSLYVLTHAHREGISLGNEAEWTAAIGSWHPTIARAILENWGMSAHLGDAVENQDVLSTLAAGEIAGLPALTRLLAASKLYHGVVSGPDAAGAAGNKLLTAVRFGGQSFVEMLASAQGEIEKVGQALAR